MEDKVISLRINSKIYQEMRRREDINWSAILRRAINQYLENTNQIDVEKAAKAAKMMDELKKSNAFKRGKSGTQIVREWREKRK